LGPSAGAARADTATAQALSSVQMAAVALPVIVDGRLVNYVFVTVKLELAPIADGALVRTKEPFFRDALVRAAHRTPFTLPADYIHLDAARIRAEILNDAVVILGRGVVHDARVIKQVPQHQIAPPRVSETSSRPELVP
jgi:hypothetical protein